MAISDNIAKIILDALDEMNGIADIQRNELAGMIGCVPSQINYVISSRFTPEKGYIVESRRGGGGYIRIKKISFNKPNLLMHTINCVGEELDESTARAFIRNLFDYEVINKSEARLITAAINDKSYINIQSEKRNNLRAKIFKSMLMEIAANLSEE